MPTLDWIGKDKVINHHQDVPYRVLEKQYTYNAEDSENMIIHGDNLEALKSLLPKYEGMIKCIYIDPPYNTGKEGWVYNDNVNDPKIKKWLSEVVGKEGDDLSRHDKWLCMMYPRLKLLQRLLADDGAIFISIDDNEFANLKLLCDEIFGLSNHIKTFIWYTSGNTDNQDVVTGVHEYILCYAKKSNCLLFNSVVDPNVKKDSKILRNFVENSVIKNGSKNPASIISLPAGFPCECQKLHFDSAPYHEEFINKVNKNGYITRELTKQYDVHYPLLIDPMTVDNYKLSRECKVFSGWMNADKLKKFIKNNCHPIKDGDTDLYFYLNHNGVIYYKRTGRESHYIQTILEKMGTTEINKYTLESMGLTFDYPKPVELIQFLISFFTQKDDVVLDSFAGSGTTAHAVINLNNMDRKNRKFILIEMMDYAETLTAERIKCVINGYGGDKSMVKGLNGNFSFYKLGEPLLVDGSLNAKVDTGKIREYVWYTETKKPLTEKDDDFYLGVHNGNAYYFFYDKDKATTLNDKLLTKVKVRANSYIMYADKCALSPEFLAEHNITFKKIPRDISVL